jgi:hypothetical protein
MRYARACAAGVIALAAASFPARARADGPASQGDVRPAAAGQGAGVAVLVRPGGDVTAGWALAQAVYADAALRPAGLDEARARVLVGEAPAADAPRGTRDLADERAAVHGDDGASRALLATIASQLGVRALLVLWVGPSEAPAARLFFTDTQSFDAAIYGPDLGAQASAIDAGGPTTAPAGSASDAGTMDASPDAQALASLPAPPRTYRWSATVESVERVMSAPVVLRAPPLATSPAPPAKPKEPESHPFYTSPWFWGAVGAAAFGGTAVWFATRDNSPSTIHLELQVPK